ncbi:MAG: hypothetical protein O7D91_03605 [Planctomycetota bacterium]|nr:hypothetical protein [Planctomycetota bacterium]
MNCKRLFRPSIVSAVLACWVVLLASCSTHFKEKYYIGVYERGAKAEGHEAGPTQFYRFRLNGWATWLSKTRYEAGWYDASVVDRLFGEIRPKAPDPADELLVDSKAPIDIIPLLYVPGEVKAANADGPTVTGNHVKVDLRGKEVTVPLSNLNKIHADRLNVWVEKKNGKTTVVVGLEVEGAIEVTYTSDEEDKTLKDLTSGQSVDVTPIAADSSMECNNVAALDLAGGIIDVTTAKLESKGETWEGINQFAFTRSPYHNFEWLGGKFQILDGKVRPKFHGLEATGSIARFSSVDSNKINITAHSGWLLRLVSAPDNPSLLKLGKVSVKAVVPGKDHKARVNKAGAKSGGSDINLDAANFKFGEDENRNIFDSEVEKLGEGRNKKPITLSNVTFHFTEDKKTVKLAMFAGEEADSPLQVPIPHYRAGTLEVKSGLFQLSTTRAVERAMEDGKTVAYQDPHRQIFIHFGPEGLGSTQRKDERFVIFMSANPRVLVNRIRALVNSERTQNVIATALIAPRLIKEKTKIQEAQLDTAQAKKFADEAKKFVEADEFGEASSAVLKGKAADWLGQLGSGPLSVLSLLPGANQTPDKGDQ